MNRRVLNANFVKFDVCYKLMISDRFGYCFEFEIELSVCWWRGLLGRTPVVAGSLSHSHARLTVGRVTILRVKCLLSVSQLGRSFRGR